MRTAELQMCVLARNSSEGLVTHCNCIATRRKGRTGRRFNARESSYKKREMSGFLFALWEGKVLWSFGLTVASENTPSQTWVTVGGFYGESETSRHNVEVVFADCEAIMVPFERRSVLNWSPPLAVVARVKRKSGHPFVGVPSTFCRQ